MKDNIKEFIEFRTDEDGTYFYYNDKDNIEQWSYKLDELKDYITNLQKENEYSDYCNKKLREKITNLEYKITTLEDYKTRNEKAIEKCKNKQYETNAPWLIKFAKDIENILQGSDE